MGLETESSGIKQVLQSSSITPPAEDRVCSTQRRTFGFGKMLSGTLFLCLFVALYSTGSPLQCKSLKHFFRGRSKASITLADTMGASYADSITEDGRGVTAVSFPSGLYKAMRTAPAEDKLSFAVQVLEEVSVLFQEDQSSASWEHIEAEKLRTVVSRQAEGLSKCIHSQTHRYGHRDGQREGHRDGQRKLNQELRAYFKSLSNQIEQMGRTAKAWELTREEIRTHLLRLDLLISPLIPRNN